MARILIIEDNPTHAELLRYLLTAAGHEVLHEEDGLSGVRTIHDRRPDLVLCDLHLRGLNGYEVVRSIRNHAELGATPVVAVTVMAQIGDDGTALRSGFNGHIAKPIDPETFVGQIEAYLPEKAAGGQHRPPPIAADSPAASTKSSLARTLREITADLTTMLDATPTATVVCDEQGRVTRWNLAAERLFGWTAIEMAGGPPPFVPEESLSEFRAVLAQAVKGAAVPDRRRRRWRCSTAAGRPTCCSPTSSCPAG